VKPGSATSGTGYSFPAELISRGSDITVEIEICQGDITNTPSKVILLGQIQGLDPTSATKDLDDAMDGNLSRLLALRNAARGPGSLDVIPTGRFPIMADLIAFLGLGKWEDFTDDTLLAAARSALRNLLASSFDEFSTTLMGGRRPGDDRIDVAGALFPMMRGFMEALRDDPDRDRFRRIVIVEQDETVLFEIHTALRQLVKSDASFKGVRTTLRSSQLRFRRTAAQPLAAQTPKIRTIQSNLLNLSMMPLGESEMEVVAMLQPAWDPDGKRRASATVHKLKRSFRKSLIAELYEAAGVNTGHGVTTTGQLEAVSQRLADLLPDGTGAPLDEFEPDFQEEPRLEIVNDAEASHVPWETWRLKDQRWVALCGGISRRFISESTRCLWPPPPGKKLRMLIVIDPTLELEGAREEGEKLLLSLSGVAEIVPLRGGEATLDAVKSCLNEQPFDVLHFAGHGGFNRQDPRLSGLRLANGQYFTGRDALALKRLPAALIFNCCELGRIERLDPVVDPKDKASREIIANRDQAHGAISLAEAFLIAGVHHYIGTFWPVNDAAATLFGTTLHTALAKGSAVGRAVTEARKALAFAPKPMPDWANYIHYGNPDAPLHTAPPAR